MSKKASNLRVATPKSNRKTRRQLANIPSRTLEDSKVTLPSPASVDAPVGQVYSSEEQALRVLVESIVAKMGDSPQERVEMAEFLDTVLDTDPELRSQILAQTTIRK